jgi:hypothetical protein
MTETSVPMLWELGFATSVWGVPIWIITCVCISTPKYNAGYSEVEVDEVNIIKPE